jgi:hypothetical protein
VNTLLTLLKYRFGTQPYWSELERQILFPDVKYKTVITVLPDGKLPTHSSTCQLQYELAPFLSAWEETLLLRTHFLNYDAELIFSKQSALFQNVLSESGLLSDILWFKEQFLSYSTPEQIITDAHWIWDEQQAKYSLMIGKELLWLLSISRCIGIIPLELLRKLKNMRCVVAGASVAAMTVDLLVSLGAQSIHCVDPGAVEPSNTPRLPHGNVQDWGASKAELLQQQLLRRNPYGEYHCHQAKIIVSEQERTEKSDVVFEELVQHADVVIEVVDQVQLKVFIHEYVLQKKPTLPLLFIADLGNEPVAKVLQGTAKGALAQPFGRVWSGQELDALSSFTPQQLAYTMVKAELPAEHKLQFVTACVGILPFWSQTPIASRMSAALAATALLQTLATETISTETFSSPRLVTSTTERDEQIHQLCRQVLKL